MYRKRYQWIKAHEVILARNSRYKIAISGIPVIMERGERYANGDENRSIWNISGDCEQLCCSYSGPMLPGQEPFKQSIGCSVKIRELNEMNAKYPYTKYRCIWKSKKKDICSLHRLIKEESLSNKILKFFTTFVIGLLALDSNECSIDTGVRRISCLSIWL